MFTRSPRRVEAKRLSGSRLRHENQDSSSDLTSNPSIGLALDANATPRSTTHPVNIYAADVPTITTSSGTPLATSSVTVPPADTASSSRPNVFSSNTSEQASSSMSPPLPPHVTSSEPFDANNSSFSVTSLDSFGAISMAGSAAAENGSQQGSRYGASPPISSLVAPRAELSSASIRSRRNWDEFEGKPVSPLPSPAVHERAQDMFDVPLASASRAPVHTSLAAPPSRPAAVRNISTESIPSARESKGTSASKDTTTHEVGSRNWSFFNAPSGPPLARAPSVKSPNLSNRDVNDSSEPTGPQSASKSIAKSNSLGHSYAARVASADLASRIRVPTRLPTLPGEAGNVRASSVMYSQTQHIGFPCHARVSSGDSTQSTDTPLYSPLSAVDPLTGEHIFNLNSTSQLSLSGISDAPSAVLDGLPPHQAWAAPDSPYRIRSRSQLMLDDDRSAQSSPSSVFPGRSDQKPWRDNGDVSTDSITAPMTNAPQRSSPAPIRSELYPPPPSSANTINGAEEARDAGSDETRAQGHQRRRQGPSESATGSSILPGPASRERPSQPAIVESREEEEEGDRIGPYRIEKTLGVGAFSRVALGRLIRSSNGGATSYLSDRLISSHNELRQRALRKNKQDDRHNDELVALKMLDREPCNNNERLKVSWVREVEVLKHISHPNLVRFITSFSTPLHHTLVLEHIAGGELFDSLMSNFDKFAQREWLVRVIYTELANAIGWMHHINLVHRDIKLENILMTVDLFAAAAASEPLRPHHLPGSGPLIKLTDFGLSRFIDASNPLLETRCGSEEYAAPELIIGKKYDGRKTDAWALGVVLYALMTGSLPFMEDVNVGVNGAREGHGEGHGEERDPKQRKRHLLRIAKGDLRWPAPANDACADTPDPAVCPANMRLVTPTAKAMVARLLRRDATKRATPWETWDEPWLLGGSFGYVSTEQAQQVPSEASAGGEPLRLHPDPRSQQGQSWLEANAAVRQDDVAAVARDD